MSTHEMVLDARVPEAGPGRAVGLPGRSTLDALRAAAALGVVAIHVHQLFLLRGIDVPWARAGDAGVSVFFVLSGYVITASIVRPASFSRRGFARRRAARILPLYYVSLLVALVLVDPGPLLSTEGRADVLAHLFFVHGFAPGMRYSINGVLWTLSIEVAFYLLIGAAAPVLRHRLGGWAFGGAMVVIGVAWRWSVFSGPDFERTAFLVQQLPGQADLFGVGILTALAVHHGLLAPLTARPWARIGLGGIGAVATAGALLAYHDRHPVYWDGQRFLAAWPLALGVGVCVLIVAAQASSGRADAFFDRTGLAYLGRISFGVYLFHSFVIAALGQAWFERGPDVSFIALLSLATAGTVVLAAVLHRAIELPAMAWARHSSTPVRDPNVGARAEARTASSSP